MSGIWGPTARLMTASLMMALTACAPNKVWKIQAPTSGGKEFDLRSDEQDYNGAPLNPHWFSQATDHSRIPPVLAACEATSKATLPDNKACTSQETSRDAAKGFRALVCGVEPGPFHGHVNWTVATYTGTVEWLNWATDGDINFRFIADTPQFGLTNFTRDESDSIRDFIELEFDAFETVDRLATSWWTGLRDKVKEWANTQSSDEPIRLHLGAEGRPIRAVVFGLFGLDCEHRCHSEVHPVYAIALELNNSASDNTWAIFGRNWGTEGFCSHMNHLLDTAQVSVALPGRGTVAPRVLADKTEFAASYPELTSPDVQFDPSKNNVVVTFTLPRPEASAVSELELHLDWAGASPQVVSPSSSPTAPEQEHVPDVEERMASWSPPGQRIQDPATKRDASSIHALAEQARASKRPNVVGVVGTPTSAIAPYSRRAPRTFVVVTRPSAGSFMVTDKESQERATLRALCAKYNGQLPDWSQAASANICTAVK